MTTKAQEIKRLVVEEGMSLADIARDLGISRQRVSIILKNAGIELGLVGGNLKAKPRSGFKRVDSSTYKLSKTNYRLKIPLIVEEKFTELNMSSADITAWMRKAIEEKAIKDFGINP